MDENFTKEPLGECMKSESPDSDIVISSRFRIARNLLHYPYPMLSTNQQSNDVLEQVHSIIPHITIDQKLHPILLSDLDKLERQVLVEKHLISPSLAEESRSGAVILSDNEAVSIMVNEEDHLRIQCIFPGFQIKEAWELGNKIDDLIESQLDYAFDEQKGFLTSCPTNVGTGIRASVMLHLPALVLTQQINRILTAITQVGLAVRGLYGEGSEAVGNLFQISNQITLGQSEAEIIENLHSVAKQIIEHERAARTLLMEQSPIRIRDRVKRSYGILLHAEVMDSKEAAQRLSDVRLGIDVQILKNIDPFVLNELMVMTQPAFLQQYAGEPLSAENRDIQRATLIREKLTQ